MVRTRLICTALVSCLVAALVSAAAAAPALANSAHAFIAIAGIVLDTAWYAPVEPNSPDSGPRWQPASIIPAQYAGDIHDGHGGFVQRHPQGL